MLKLKKTSANYLKNYKKGTIINMNYKLLLIALLPFSASAMEKENQANSVKIIPCIPTGLFLNQPEDKKYFGPMVNWEIDIKSALLHKNINKLKQLIALPIARTQIPAVVNNAPSFTPLINYVLLNALCHCEDNECTKFFFNAATEFNICNSNGATPLRIACDYNLSPSIIKLLIEKGSPINTSGAYKNLFPLHLAHSSEIINLLVKAGAKIDSKDEDGYTPLLLNACNYKYAHRDNKHRIYENIVTLISYGADISTTDKYQKKNLTTFLDAETINELLDDAEIEKRNRESEKPTLN